MVGLYCFKAKKNLRYHEENDSMKYRMLFDRIPGCTSFINKLYNMVYLLAKVFVVIAIVAESAALNKIVFIVFPILFVVHHGV